MNYIKLANFCIPIAAAVVWATAAYWLVSAAIAAVVAVFAVSPLVAVVVALASAAFLVWLGIWTIILGTAAVAGILLWVNGAFK